MKTGLLIILLFTSLNIFAQDSCVVKAFPNDCKNCYIGLKVVEAGSKDIKKTIVFPNLSEAETKAYITKVFNISDPSSFNIIASDSIYNSINNSLTSEVYLYSKDQLEESMLLKNFHGFDSEESMNIKIPDSLAISYSAVITNNDDYFLIVDHKFNNIILIEKRKPHMMKVITARQLTTESNFNKISGDTLCYHMFLKHNLPLKEANMDIMQFKPSFGTKSNLGSFILAPDIKGENNELSLEYKMGIIIFKNPSDYKILNIDDSSLPENYFIKPVSFSEYSGQYYIQVINIDRTLDDQFILGKFKKVNNTLVFSEFVPFKIPDEYLPSSKFEKVRKIMISEYPYIFLQYSRSYFNLESNKVNMLPLDPVNFDVNISNNTYNSTFKYNYKIMDVFSTKKYLQILLKESDKFYTANVDLENNKLMNKREINGTFETLKSGMYFYSKDKLLYLTRDNNIVIEKIEYK